MSEQNQPLTDKQLLQNYVRKMKAKGWQVESASVSMGVSMKKPKRWNRLLIILGLIGLLFGGLGIILLILAVIDYLIKKDRSVFVTADDLRAGKEPIIASDWNTPMILAGLLIGGFMAMIIFYFVIGLLLG